MEVTYSQKLNKGFSQQTIDRFQETDRLVQLELSKLNIPQSDFDGMAKVVCHLNKEYSQLKKDNYSAFLVLLLTATYKAGRESEAKL